MVPYQKPHDGGAAFPLHPYTVRASSAGMSLRDWFAGQALLSIVASCMHDARQDGETPSQMIARKAYEVADAMLAAREAQP
jgi:hypothetical protein